MGVVLGLLKFGQSVVNEGLAWGTSRVPRRGVAVDLRGSWLRESRLPRLKIDVRKKNHKLEINVLHETKQNPKKIYAKKCENPI